MGAGQERRHPDPARILQPQQDAAALTSRSGPTTASSLADPTSASPRISMPGASTACSPSRCRRHAEAHVDADCERTDIDHLLLAESRLLGQLLQAPGQRQRAAVITLLRERAHDDQVLRPDRADAVGARRQTSCADVVGLGCADASQRGEDALAVRNRASAAARGNQDAVAIIGGQVIGGARAGGAAGAAARHHRELEKAPRTW